MSDHGRGHAWRKCSWCGRFVSYDDMYNGRALTHFTPDTEFTTETIEVEHIKCKEKYEHK